MVLSTIQLINETCMFCGISPKVHHAFFIYGNPSTLRRDFDQVYQVKYRLLVQLIIHFLKMKVNL